MKKILSIVLSFLLTAALILFGVCLISRQVVIPAMSRDGAQVGSNVIREEIRLAHERINVLSELYGFTAEPVIAFVDEDTLRELNRQASLWWSSIVKDGRAGDEIFWDTDELERILAEDPALNEAEDSEEAENTVVAAAEEVRESVLRIVLPMRQQVIRLGLDKVAGRIDLPNLIEFFLGLSWAALALCALLAGLIALLESQRFSSLVYIGSALGGAALVLAAITALILCAGILPMIREASESLTIQYRAVQSRGVLTAAILIAVLTAGSFLCLKQRRKGGKAA